VELEAQNRHPRRLSGHELTLTERLHSVHLYQLSAYVRHHPRAASNKATVEGLLLYPLVDTPLDILVSIDGQRIQARTIDLTKSWETIHSDLIKMIGSPGLGQQ
jgi:5-methylcytosine-specific restriction enzyme subunit McrC